MLVNVFELLPAGAFKRILLLLGFQIFGTFLDIGALILLSVLSVSGLSYVEGNINEITIFDRQITLIDQFSFVKQFFLLAVLVVMLFIIRSILAIWGNRRILSFLARQSAIASENILSKLLLCKPQFILSKKSQELLYGTTSGVDVLVLGLIGASVLFLSESFFLFCILLTLVITNPILGLSTICLFGVSSFIINSYTTKNVRTKSIHANHINIEYNNRILEMLSIFRELVLRGQTSQSVGAILLERKKYLKLKADISLMPILSKYFFEVVLVLGIAAIVGAQFFFSDTKSAISTAVVFLAASSRILPSIVRLQSALLSFRQSEGSGKITLDLLSEINENQERFESAIVLRQNFEGTQEAVTIRGLSFRYPGNTNFAIEKISFNVQKGSLVAIVGESGAGKSTLADLILGMLEPDSGEVLLFGQPSRKYILENPGMVGYVPQEVSIVSGSMGSNISLVDSEDLSQEKFYDVISKAQLSEDSKDTSNGLNGEVGEKGINLSGGQKQRLGIARAIFTKPALIVFDEATSSLDPITEKAVTEAIYSRDENTTLLVIAHRLSTVRKADLVLLVEKGRLIAYGTFEEVRNQSPKFDKQAKLVNL